MYDVASLGALLSTRRDSEQYQSEITTVLELDESGTAVPGVSFPPVKMSFGEMKQYTLVSSVGTASNF